MLHPLWDPLLGISRVEVSHWPDGRVIGCFPALIAPVTEVTDEIVADRTPRLRAEGHACRRCSWHRRGLDARGAIRLSR
jgi:hypothetical protein